MEVLGVAHTMTLEEQRPDVLNEAFCKRLHKEMFKNTCVGTVVGGELR